MTGKDWQEQFETYTVEKMYAYLSSFKLSRDPGTEYEYSNFGSVLLGHVLSLKAGTNFESLLLNRICSPVAPGQYPISLTAEMKSRLAMAMMIPEKFIRPLNSNCMPRQVECILRPTIS
jgi:CubicO group peptidase (beta-lactamase class C family)